MLNVGCYALAYARASAFCDQRSFTRSFVVVSVTLPRESRSLVSRQAPVPGAV